MTLAQLISAYRTDANDKAVPYFASDDEVTGWLNEAQDEAAIRGRLLHEGANPDVCRSDVTPGTAVYPLHPSLYELTYAAFVSDDDGTTTRLRIVSTEMLDAIFTDWRTMTGDPLYAVQGDTSLRLVPAPDTTGELVLEGYRTAVSPMTLTAKESDAPEINALHHRHLVDWALFRGFSIPDSEAFDPNRAAIAESAFSRYFGLRPDADLRRITREDVPQVVEAFWI